MADLFCSSARWTAVTAWAAVTSYIVGDLRRQLAAIAAGDERVFRCTTAGLSGAAEPTWNLGANATTADGTAVWTEVTGSSTYNTLGGTFAAPFARMRTLASRMAAGDRGFVRNDHAATEAAAVSITTPGSSTTPCELLGVNSAGALALGASETTTGTNDLNIAGFNYVFGIAFNCGTGTGSPNLRLSSTNGGEQVFWESCDFSMLATGAFAFIFVRADGANKGDSRFKNCRARFGATTNQFFVLSGGEVRFVGGSALAGGSNIAALFSLNSARPVVIDGFDFSGYHAAIDVFTGGWGGGKGIVRNCKMPAGWTGAPFNASPASLERVELWNCSDGDQNYRVWIEDDRGTLRDEIVLVKTGGASDGDTPLAWRIITTADARHKLRVFRAPEIMRRINTVGAPVTITVDILRDSATALTDADIWVEVQYLGATGFPLSLFIEDAKADVLATAANQTTSTATWTTTGMSNPNRQKLEVTFTPQEKGVAIVTVCVARASTTVYVDPIAQVS